MPVTNPAKIDRARAIPGTCRNGTVARDRKPAAFCDLARGDARPTRSGSALPSGFISIRDSPVQTAVAEFGEPDAKDTMLIRSALWSLLPGGTLRKATGDV